MIFWPVGRRIWRLKVLKVVAGASERQKSWWGTSLCVGRNLPPMLELECPKIMNTYSQTGKIRVDRGIFNKSSYILRRPLRFDESFKFYLKLLSSVNFFFWKFCHIFVVFSEYMNFKSKALVNYVLFTLGFIHCSGRTVLHMVWDSLTSLYLLAPLSSICKPLQLEGIQAILMIFML